MARKSKELKIVINLKPFSKEREKALTDFIIKVALENLEKKFPAKKVAVCQSN